MPELPEVEVSRLGIAPALEGNLIERVIVRQPMLRWPVAAEVIALQQQPVQAVRRRAKYLLIDVPQGSIIVHLGMSGHLKIVPAGTPPLKHDHVDWVLADGRSLRLNDSRRFGAVLWQQPAQPHALLAALGPEPLTDDFDGALLFERCQSRSSAIKLVLMDNHVVVGVGNIYANEALFKARIRPTTPARQLSLAQCTVLAAVVKQTLAAAIVQGGTTLKDFSDASGKAGYFKQELLVYGRGGQPCLHCQTPLDEIRLGQRSTVYCPQCQPSAS